MEFAAFDGQGLGLVLAFSVGIAVWVRYTDKYRLEGQTFWQVVVGVAGTIAVAGDVIGWEAVGTLIVYFSVAAVPVGVEYFWRVFADIREGQKVMEGWVDGNSGKGREARVQGGDCGCEVRDCGGADAVEASDEGEPK